MNFTIAAVALAVSAIAGGFASYKATSLHYEHKIDLAAKQAQVDIDAANQKAQNAADDWEVWQSIQKPKTITITREVSRAVQNDPDCSKRALPVGMRDALTKAGQTNHQPIADGALPAASSAGLGDLGRHSRGLFGYAAGASGVLKAP